MSRIKLFLFASLMLTISLEREAFAQCTTNCTPLNETFGSTANCAGFAQGTSNAAIVNHSLQAYSPGGAGDAPNDGEYSIRCDGDENNSGWFGPGFTGTTMADHTVDPAGQFGNYTIINAVGANSEFYHKTVSNLCPSTTYNLTYYAGNITRESSTPGVCNYNNLPSLKAYVFPGSTAVTGTGAFTGTGGTLLGSTGPISCPSQTTFTWNTYSYNFTTGAGQTSVDVVLETLFGNNAGYDFAFDDVVVTWVSGGGVSCTAPVDLISFTAEKAPDNVLLKWSTATEENFSHFVVERSTDGINFQQIAIIYGSGNGKSKIDYIYTDNSDNQGIIYYRLKQVDKDGTFKYSPISNVNVDITSPVFIYSSDADLTIHFTAKGEATYAVFDMLGRAVYSGSRTADESVITIGKSNFTGGVYIVKVQMGTELVTKKIVLN